MAKITDLLKEYGEIKVDSKNPNRSCCDCPLCKDKNDVKFSMIILDKENKFMCYSCGESGDGAYLENKLSKIKELQNITKKMEFNSTFKKSQSSISDQNTENIMVQKNNYIYSVNKIAANYFYKNLMIDKNALKYFTERGLSEKTIKKFGLGYSTDKNNDLYNYLKKQKYNNETLKGCGVVKFTDYGKGYDIFKNRVMFPIMDVDNKVIGFGGRVLDDSKPKYINTPATDIFNKKEILYGMNYAQSSKRGNIILCEGYMDVIALHQAGFDNAVATLGTAFNKSHAIILKGVTDTVYCTFDGDEAGTNAKLKAIPIMRDEGLNVNIIDLSPYKDPDEFIKNEGKHSFENRMINAESSYDFEIKVLYQRNNEQDFMKLFSEKLYASNNEAKQHYKKAYENFTQKGLIKTITSDVLITPSVIKDNINAEEVIERVSQENNNFEKEQLEKQNNQNSKETKEVPGAIPNDTPNTNSKDSAKIKELLDSIDDFDFEYPF